MTFAITLIPAFDPASTFIILALILGAPLILLAGLAFGRWGRNASQAGEFDVDTRGRPVDDGDDRRPRHTTVSSETLENTVSPADDAERAPRPTAS